MDNFKDKLINGNPTHIRLRTWALTAAIIVSLICYYLVSVTVHQVDLVSFSILATLQIVLHVMYFPEGELYGRNDTAFKSNKAAYNEKATEINSKGLLKKLDEYCSYEFEVRKKKYIEHSCNRLGISVEELNNLRGKTKKEIKRMKYIEFNGRSIAVTKQKRRILNSLLFEPLPVEENNPDVILSATECGGSSSIKDRSITFKSHSIHKKVFMALVVGLIMSYIGYTSKDGIGLAEVVDILTCFTTMLITAVMSFSAGETNTKVHKNNFYLSLSNFIDGFFEWANISEE